MDHTSVAGGAGAGDERGAHLNTMLTEPGEFVPAHFADFSGNSRPAHALQGRVTGRAFENPAHKLMTVAISLRTRGQREVAAAPPRHRAHSLLKCLLIPYLRRLRFGQAR